MRITLLFVFIMAITGCIGTDLVDVPLGPSAAEAVIEESELSLIKEDTFTLSYKLISIDGSEVAAEWEWSSRDFSIADVDQKGTVTAYEPGQTWVDGIANGSFRDSILVTVVADANAIASVRIEGDTTNMEIDEMRQLTAVLRNVAGDVLVGEVSWMSNNTAIASVDDNGLVTAVSDGVTNIVGISDDVSSVPFEIAVGANHVTRTGMFSGRNGYNAQGTAILETIGAETILAFGGNFITQSGPGLYVYLSPNAQNVVGGLSLGELKSTSGAQAYDLPGSANPAMYDYVIIYCKPFGVLFAVAALEE